MKRDDISRAPPPHEYQRPTDRFFHGDLSTRYIPAPNPSPTLIYRDTYNRWRGYAVLVKYVNASNLK